MKNYNYNINIIGLGYVGGAISHLCKLNDIHFNVYDTIPKDTPFYFSDLKEMVINSELTGKLNVYFICVPTPSKDNGNNDDHHGDCDTSIVEMVMNQLGEYITEKSVIILKSTVTPGTSNRLNNSIENKNISFVFCPEFLKEATYLDDIANAEFTLLGTSNNIDTYVKMELSSLFTDLYKHKQDPIDIIFEEYTICEMFKYTVNVFLSVKVWYFNEIHQVCEKFGIEYNKLRSLFKLEERIGESHTQVPGPDGKMGFGGKCLVKESKGMARLQEKLGIPNEIMRSILLRNKLLRKNGILEKISER